MANTKRGYYEVLGVQKNATADEIHHAFRLQAKRWHPDRNRNNRIEAEEKFKEIVSANSILSDPVARQKYDYDCWIEEINRLSIEIPIPNSSQTLDRFYVPTKLAQADSPFAPGTIEYELLLAANRLSTNKRPIAAGAALLGSLIVAGIRNPKKK